MYTMAGIGVAIGVSGIYTSSNKGILPALPYSTSLVTCAVVFGITTVGVTGGVVVRVGVSAGEDGVGGQHKHQAKSHR